MALLHIKFRAYYDGGETSSRQERPHLMASVPHPKRELLKLCARIGYTPH